MDSRAGDDETELLLARREQAALEREVVVQVRVSGAVLVAQSEEPRANRLSAAGERAPAAARRREPSHCLAKPKHVWTPATEEGESCPRGRKVYSRS